MLLLTTGLAYQLFASRQGELKLYAHNLLNQNQPAVRIATDTCAEAVRSPVLGR